MKLKSVIFGFCAALLCLGLSGCKWGNDDDKKTEPGPAPSGYEITVYNDGVAKKAEADSYTADDDVLSYHLKTKDSTGNDNGKAQGAWVVKHNAWKAAASEKRYQVTLYNGKKAVGTWTVRSFSTDSRSVLLFPSDGSEVLRVSGDVVITALAGGSKAEATSVVTVYNGESPVYKVPVSSYIVIGHYLQGEAADGSGAVFIWGNYKVENTK